MIFYLCNGDTLAPTQADARKLDPNFEQVDIPTDKGGLMSYLNNILAGNAHDDTIVEETTGPAPTGECLTCQARSDAEQQAVQDFTAASRTVDGVRDYIKSATPAELGLIAGAVSEGYYLLQKELTA